jgi:hypothetical protein
MALFSTAQEPASSSIRHFARAIQSVFWRFQEMIRADFCVFFDVPALQHNGQEKNPLKTVDSMPVHSSPR